MKIEELVWLRSVVDKISSKHRVETFEVEEVFKSQPKFAESKKENEKVRMYILH